MESISRGSIFLIAVLSLLVSCGSDGGGAAPSCTPNGNISLHTSATTTAPLLGLSVSVSRGNGVHTSLVFVRYTSPPVAAIAAGYPPGTADPRTLGIDIVQTGQSPADNPLQFSLIFDRTMPLGTYQATWRFVAVDAGVNMVGCQDLPVSYTTFTF